MCNTINFHINAAKTRTVFLRRDFFFGPSSRIQLRKIAATNRFVFYHIKKTQSNNLTELSVLFVYNFVFCHFYCRWNFIRTSQTSCPRLLRPIKEERRFIRASRSFYNNLTVTVMKNDTMQQDWFDLYSDRAINNRPYKEDSVFSTCGIDSRNRLPLPLK